MNKDFFTDKTVLVMGLGRFGGGADVAAFASNAGANVIVTDLASADKLTDSIDKLKTLPNIEFHLGSHDKQDFKQADIIVANPAVPADSEFLKIAKQNNRLITSQINIFFELCPAKIIAITGSNGKSTTTSLTAHLLRAGLAQDNVKYTNVWLGGNIGNKPLLTIVDQIKPNDLVVLELSNFQTEQLAQIQQGPAVALVTNLTPNHLDRYDSFEDYCKAKDTMFKYQKRDPKSPAVSIFNAEDKLTCDWFNKYNQQEGRTCLKFSSQDISQELQTQFNLPGKINLSNLAAAIAITKSFEVEDAQIKKALPEFKALPHRLELVAEANGIRWYNDSKATTPQSSIAAIRAFDNPTIIIAGGYDKKVNFTEFGKEIAKKTKAAILIGQTAEQIKKAISKYNNPNLSIQTADSLQTAVKLAGQLATAGDVVLLSPACASFDMFTNYQQRGLEFTRLAKNHHKL